LSATHTSAAGVPGQSSFPGRRAAGADDQIGVGEQLGQLVGRRDHLNALDPAGRERQELVM
jgi:hypothetical protein